MNVYKFLGIPLLLMCLIIAFSFQSCEPDDCGDEPDCDTCFVVYKPNIYIHPNDDIQLKVTLDFPLGGKIVASIPQYNDGWLVSVDKNGLINDNYTFLFYESTQPDIWQRSEGWIVKKSELESFFSTNMKLYGFAGQEIQDYIDYWIPRLDNHMYYAIYPQTNEIIDKVIELNFSIQPDNVLRLFYVIKGFNSFPNVLAEPQINKFNREGYFVTEWGVILK